MHHVPASVDHATPGRSRCNRVREIRVSSVISGKTQRVLPAMILLFIQFGPPTTRHANGDRADRGENVANKGFNPELVVRSSPAPPTPLAKGGSYASQRILKTREPGARQTPGVVEGSGEVAAEFRRHRRRQCANVRLARREHSPRSELRWTSSVEQVDPTWTRSSHGQTRGFETPRQLHGGGLRRQ